MGWRPWRRFTGVPLQQSLVLPDLSSSLTENSSPFTALCKLATRPTPLVYHRSRNVNTLLGENADIILVGVGRNWGTVTGGGSRNSVGRALIWLVIWVHVVSSALLIVGVHDGSRQATTTSTQTHHRCTALRKWKLPNPVDVQILSCSPSHPTPSALLKVCSTSILSYLRSSAVSDCRWMFIEEEFGLEWLDALRGFWMS